MRHTLLLITVALSLGVLACSTTQTTEKTGSNDNGDWSTSLTSDDLKADYAIGGGWIPFEEVYKATTWEPLNLRENPTTDAPIAATIDAGTPLELYGVSVACSLVMSRAEWIEYVLENKPM